MCQNLSASHDQSFSAAVPVYLTSDQQAFLTRHHIPEHKVFDATGMKRQGYREVMETFGYFVAVGVTPCKNWGHSMRNRFGTCLQCNPAAISFERRYEERASIYVAHSPSSNLVKVGITIDIADRERSLNSHGYAQANDWEIVHSQWCDAAARVELQVQNRLALYYSPTDFIKSGEWVQCKETFSCDVTTAVGVIETVIAGQAGR